MNKDNDAQEQELAPEQLLLKKADALLLSEPIEQLLQEHIRQIVRAHSRWLNNLMQELGEDNV